ncbi:MAG: hypothetical protein AAF545_00415 [Pseudomonadota bacterium]
MQRTLLAFLLGGVVVGVAWLVLGGGPEIRESADLQALADEPETPRSSEATQARASGAGYDGVANEERAGDDTELPAAETTSGAASAAEAQAAFLDSVLTQALGDRATGKINTVSEAERLAAYDQFSRERVDPVWSAEIMNRFNEGMAQLSRIDKGIAPELIECRASTCLVRFPKSPGEDMIAVTEPVAYLMGASGMIARNTIQQSDQYSDVYITDIKSFRTDE